MVLEKKYLKIDDIVFDDKTFIDNHILHISKTELEALVSDKAFSKVSIELAHPGESIRLSNVCDIVQPVFKEDGPTFPGVTDPVNQVGSGSTYVLDNVAVAEVCEIRLPLGCFLDMTGPAVEHSELSKNHIVAIDAVPAGDASNEDYLLALNMSSFKVAKFLGQAACGLTPDFTKEYRYEKLENSDLPKVAYIFQQFSHAPLTDFMFYGSNCHDMIPTIVQPTELIDGSMVNRDYYQLPNADPTFLYQNHPMVLELLDRHGKDINFVGVIFSNAPAQVEDKKRNAILSVSLAKNILEAEGVIITKEGGGHPQIDLKLNCELSEENGMSSVILISEFLSLYNSSDEVVIFSSENANAMISSGCLQKFTAPEVTRVIGSTDFLDAASQKWCCPKGPFEHENRYVRGSLSQLGGTNFTSLIY